MVSLCRWPQSTGKRGQSGRFEWHRLGGTQVRSTDRRASRVRADRHCRETRLQKAGVNFFPRSSNHLDRRCQSGDSAFGRAPSSPRFMPEALLRDFDALDRCPAQSRFPDQTEVSTEIVRSLHSALGLQCSHGLYSQPMTDSPPYWRTRTIADAERDGYTHLRVTCPKCGREVMSVLLEIEDQPTWPATTK